MKNHQVILSKAQRICIIRTDRIGDMVLTLPMVKVLKKISPDAEIDLIASEATKPLLDNQPLINKVYFIENIANFICFLKDRKYDVAFFPRPKPKEIFASFLAKNPLRVGSAYRFYSILLNHRVKEHRKFGKKSEAQHNLDLISSITHEQYNIELIPPVIKPEAKERLMTDYHLPRKFVIIHPGGGGSAPKLPIEKFSELAKILISKYNLNVVLTGNDRETVLTNLIEKDNTEALNLAGKITLNELIALIDLSDGIITNSTGVIHIAASLDKQIVGFYPNSPQINSTRWGPISNKKVILTPHFQKIEDRDKMDLISIEKIEDAVTKLFLNNLDSDGTI